MSMTAAPAGKPATDAQALVIDAVHGPENRPTLVFIHGWCCRRDYWQAQVDALRGDYPMWVADLPGHGDSPASGTHTIETLADTLIQALRRDSRGISGPVVLIGHSMGGAVALEAAARLGPQAAGVILVDSFVIDYGGLDADTQGAIHAPFRADFSAAMADLIDNTSTALTPVALKARLKREMADADPARALPLWAALLAWQPDALAQLDCPIHAINGSLIPDSARTRCAPWVSEIVVPGTGHFLQMEVPDQVNAHLRDLLADIAAWPAR
ncbi:alpha/beta fold hydrolase [Alcanivorax sp. JB21]|uniref:alpha/beta fold hydrolase n=1 Tax=Alcanivorax limicola TaxID=2874102 RepID=UPI001CBE393B|nr:alpha/beta fold hydrolase [Alcanivorax limicola]MBZ2189116.1 alpha/beta fold hydrolase [Alcanivorax limicola]